MLQQRLITGFAVVVFLVSAIFLLTPAWFFLFLVLVAVLAALEWAQLLKIQSKSLAGMFAITVVAACFVLNSYKEYATILNTIGVLMWMFFALSLSTRWKLEAKNNFMQLCAVAVLSFAVFAMFNLYSATASGKYWLTAMFVLVAIADSSAYFIGKKFGVTKLAPKISPGKTLEGLLGSVGTVITFAIVAGFFMWGDNYLTIVAGTFMCAALVFFAVLGDLFISKQKRHAGVKDTGTLLPGHGGVLDRIDSVLCVAPIYAVGVNVIQQIDQYQSQL